MPVSWCEPAANPQFVNPASTRRSQWSRLLTPFYRLAERIPSKRESALRLGLATIDQMIASLVHAVEHPVRGIEIIDAPVFAGVSDTRSQVR